MASPLQGYFPCPPCLCFPSGAQSVCPPLSASQAWFSAPLPTSLVLPVCLLSSQPSLWLLSWSFSAVTAVIHHEHPVTLSPIACTSVSYTSNSSQGARITERWTDPEGATLEFCHHQSSFMYLSSIHPPIHPSTHPRLI